MTPQQRQLLRECLLRGYVERATAFGRGQRNRCAYNLVHMGFLRQAWVPENSLLRVQGWVLTEEGREAAERA